jgi:hypothetical protein
MRNGSCLPLCSTGEPREVKTNEGCGNDGREEARGKPLAEVKGEDLRIMVFHRLPQPLESSAHTADLSTFPQPEAVLFFQHKLRAFGAEERSPA